MIEESLVGKKKNINKIKQAYQTKEYHRPESFYYPSYSGYTKVIRWTPVRTRNEVRQNDAIMEDYPEFNLVRGRRRERALPCSWDSRRWTGVGEQRSWKHNSKRERQWKL